MHTGPPDSNRYETVVRCETLHGGIDTPFGWDPCWAPRAGSFSPNAVFWSKKKNSTPSQLNCSNTGSIGLIFTMRNTRWKNGQELGYEEKVIGKKKKKREGKQ
ncbi:hypothetical protein GcM3_048033 [Golovinomyces cichoracearum]|uniref:Uncharacterized protein n=1 Tax=Golovinomyces cichoracearum TaxID=62708 RepID=A0A420J082_9PEZI|nr:hypothetical protein GcM3_048033 [Golovinomyces cichoracearum]